MGTPSPQTKASDRPGAALPPVFPDGCGAVLLALLAGAACGGLSGWCLAEVVAWEAVPALGGLYGGALGGITAAAFAGRKQPPESPGTVLSPHTAMVVAAVLGGLAGVAAALLGEGLQWRPGTEVAEEYLATVAAGVGAACGAVGGLIGGAIGAAAAGGEYL